MAFVYWIHLPEHTNMFSEGYIGYTSKTVEHRWKGHLKESTRKRNADYPIYRAISKYGDILIVETILEGDEGYCLAIENKLRPDRKIGWNLQEGGNKGTKGIDVTAETRAKISKAGRGRKFSEEHKKKIGIANSKRICTEETKKNMSEARIGKPRKEDTKVKHSATMRAEPWRNRSTIKRTWIDAEKLYESFLSISTLSLASFCEFVQRPETQMKCIFSKFLSGWIPKNDVLWLKFSEQNKENNNV